MIPQIPSDLAIAGIIAGAVIVLGVLVWFLYIALRSNNSNPEG